MHYHWVLAILLRNSGPFLEKSPKSGIPELVKNPPTPEFRSKNHRELFGVLKTEILMKYLCRVNNCVRDPIERKFEKYQPRKSTKSGDRN